MSVIVKMATEKKQRLVPPEERFAEFAAELMDLLRKILLSSKQKPEMKNFNMACLYVENEDEIPLTKSFAESSHSHWHHIYERNRNYFENLTSSLANEKYKKKIDPYIKMVLKNGLTKKQEDEVWELLHCMVKSTIQFLHENKNYHTENVSKFEKMEKLEEMATKWGITLGKPMYETDSDDSNDSDEDSNGDSGEEDDDSDE